MCEDRVTAYARETIAAGTACRAVILACERHLRDLKNDSFEWRPDEADKYLRFAESLHYYDDKKKKSLPLVLKGFQVFIIGSLFGWYRNGSRRFTDAYLQIGRKNGKSFLSAFFALAFSFVCPVRDGEIYCAGTEQRNALLCWREAKKFIEREPALKKRYKIMDYRSEILHKRNGTFIKAISGNVEIDGPKPYLAINDEAHLAKTDAMYSVLRDGQVGLSGALSIIITTSGFDLNRYCYKQYVFAKSVLSAGITQENLFVFICEADLPDAHEDPDGYERELWSPDQWKKANPLLLDTDDPVVWQKFRDKAEEAKTLGGTRLRDFIVKHLDVWRSVGGSPYIPAESWIKCGVEKDLSEFTGRDVIVGLDLSSKNDLASLCLLIPPLQGEKVYVYSHSFLPKNSLARHIRSDRAPYDVWAQQGQLTLTDCGGTNGFILDYKYILEHLRKLLRDYKLRPLMICYDPMGASGIISDLEEICSELVEVGQYPKSMNDACRFFQGTVLGGGVEFDKKNELLTWSMINAQAVTDSKMQMIIEKRFAVNRIDAIDALLDAVKGWLTIRPEPEENAEEKADAWLDIMSKL